MSDEEFEEGEEERTLAEDFLADLEELESGDDEELEDMDDMEAMDDGEEGDEADDVKSIATLMSGDTFKRVMADIEKYQEQNEQHEILGDIEDEPEYKLIVETNALSTEMDSEIALIHKFTRDNYAKKFPELENLVTHPIDYARVVLLIGNEMDMTLVNLEEVLLPATIMVVSVTGSTTNGKALPESELKKVMDACNETIVIAQAKAKMLEYVESRMMRFAPNMSVIMGTSLAAQMIGLAGGLTSLSNIPSCNIQALGTKKQAASMAKAGMAKAGNNGLISRCDIVVGSPSHLKQRAIRLVAGKITLCSRIDSFHQDPMGRQGQRFREEITKRLEKLQEPPPAKQAKPLPVPMGGSKKKRGGKRYRKMKEQYAMTEARKLQNRVLFGKVQDDDLEGRSMGMLGLSSGSGKVRVNMDSKKMKKALQRQKKRNFGSSGATSGLTSSLAFTPVQGLELENPNLKRKAKGNSKYFSANAGFRSVGPQAHTPKTGE